MHTVSHYRLPVHPLEPRLLMASTTLSAVGDSYVRDGSFSTSNFGAATDLVVKRSGTDFNREAGVRFDLSSIGSNVTSAKLRVFGALQDNRATNVVTEVYGSTTGWAESSVTWNTRPSVSSPLLANFAVTNATAKWYEIDVTAYVAAEKAAGRNAVSLLLKNPATAAPYTAFQSRETSNKPSLALVHDTGGTAPQPTVSIAATDASAAEAGSDPGTFTISRTGDTTAPLVVGFAVGGSATNGSDYTALPASITIPAGATSAAVSVIPVDDAAVEGTENVVVTLSAGSSYVVDGLNNVATVVLADNDSVSAAPVTLTASADTYARDGTDAARNFGGATELVVKKSAAGYNRETFLKFDLSTLGADVTSATLRIFAKLQTNNGANIPTDVYGTSTAWQESTLTWNNRPAATTSKLGTAVVKNATAQWYEVDVTNFVKAQRGGGAGSVSLLLRNPTASDPYTGLASREAVNRPQLVVATTAQPPPPPGPGQSPYGGAAAVMPGVIEAERFDEGGEGVAYHDLDAANVSGSFRPAEGVDIEPTTDTGGGFNLGHVQAGEWLEYTINVPQSGRYDIGLRFASGSSGGTAHVDVGGANVTGSITLNNTGGWQTWQTVWTNGLSLLTGQNQVLRLAIDSSNIAGQDVGNVNSIMIRAAATTPAPITWTTAAPYPMAIEESMSATVGGKLYAFGGLYSSSYLATDRVEVYDPASNTWSSRRPMPEKLTHSATVVDGTTVWFIGGYLGNHPGPGTTSVWKYDTLTDTWTRGPALPVASGAGGAGLIGRTIYYFGGKNETRTEEANTNRALNLDNLAAGWTDRTPMQGIGRDHFSYAALGGYVYAIGGRIGPDEMGTNQVQVDRYDPVANAWTRVADLPGTISNTTSATFIKDGSIYILGGETSHNVAANIIWSYDPVIDRWTEHTPLPQPRRAGIAGLINGKIIYTGGWYLGVQRAETWIGT